MTSVSEAPFAAQQNEAATLFKELCCHFQLDPCSQQTESCAANLAAFLASSKGFCVGIVPCNQLRQYFGVLSVLNEYGVVGRSKRLVHHNSFLVFLEIERDEAPSEFEGAVVKARYLRPVMGVAA